MPPDEIEAEKTMIKNESLAEALDKLKAEHENWYEAVMAYYFTDDEFVCKDNFGKLVTPNFITDHFKIVVDNNNLRHLRFHDLRHSCASLLVANGISMKAIQEWLGHSTFNVTANYYSHLDYGSKIVSADTISKVLAGEEDKPSESDTEDKENRKSSE